MRAAANGHTETMRLLLSKVQSNLPPQIPNTNTSQGASLDQHDKYNNNALMLCCRKGKLDSMQLVLEHNPLILHERKKNGFTAFLWACNLGYVEAARYLLEKGASADDRDEGTLTLPLRNQN